MENSRNNSMKNLTITSSSQEHREDNNDNSPEESSWTFYIQDFPYENEHANQNNSLSSSSCYDMSASLLSDAASSAVKTGNYQKDGGLNGNYKKNFFRKRKVILGAAMDEDLEDTASSPVNSPKVSSFMNDFEMKRKELPNAYLEEIARKSSSSRDGVGGDNGDMTELTKRGLCLVPLSNVANYFSY